MESGSAGRSLRDQLDPHAGRVYDLGGALEQTDVLAVVLDGAGRIAACSPAWLDAAAARGLDPRAVGVGTDYLAACETSEGDDGGSATAAEGIRSVLHGDRRQFTMDYECSHGEERRWFTMRVAHLTGPGSGALVTHLDITTVRSAELAVRGRSHELWTVADPHADFVFLLDEDAEVLSRTRDRSRSIQWPVVGQSALDVVHPDDREPLRSLFEVLIAEPGSRWSGGIRAAGSDDRTWSHFTLTAVNMMDDPSVGGVVVEVVDVTRRLRDLAATALANALADDVSVTALATDDKGIITAINAGACALLGVEAADAIGRTLRDFVAPVSEEEATALRRTIAGGNEWAGELDVVLRDGSQVPVAMRVCELEDPVSGFRGRSILALDHSEARNLQRSLDRQRLHDPLTGLLNRSAFRIRLRRLCRSLHAGESAVAAAVDLDRFADINTVHGTAVGDGVLRQVGCALQRVAGADGFVGRLYGDVFVVASAQDEDPARFGAALQRAIEVVHPTPDLALQMSASIGLRTVTCADEDTRVVLADLSISTDAAKELGGRRVQQYDEALRLAIDERAVLTADLARAIELEQLAVVFQPVVRLEDGVVVAAEALLRWNHPTAGKVPPDTFIALAEQSPVIHELGAFVLEESCRQAARWRDLRPELPVKVSVNLSASQLTDATLAERLRAALLRHDLYPSMIMLELTESMLLDFDGASEHLTRLRATGVSIAIDDFGTGYSSLSRLKQLPFDVLKFDRSFVTGIGSSPEDASIVGTVVSLAEAFGVDVVAEGVETAADASALRSMGCALGQGYFWSAAVVPDAFDRVLRSPFPAVEAAGVVDRPAEDARAATEALRTFQHELSTPLAVLRMSVDLREPDGTMAAEVVETVARNVTRASRLLRDLDLLDQIDRGTLRPELEDVDIVQLVHTVVDRLSTSAGRRIDIQGLEGRAGLRMRGDASLIDVVVTNLVANAVKYAPGPVSVAVRSSADQRVVRIAVQDAGPGIPPARLGVVWRKFGRLSHARPGSGIGLYLARGIARAHGGDVRYEPAPQGGSIFTLRLPASPTTDAAAQGREGR